MSALFSIRQLEAAYRRIPAVRGVSLDLEPGKILGIVGESGSGKSTLIQGALGILGPEGAVTGGSVLFRGQDLLRLPREAARRLRGKELSLVAQNPMESFHPMRRIRSELAELVKAHPEVTLPEARKEMLRLLAAFQLPNGEEILNRYASQLSGGICQRTSLALAMSLRPAVLFGDEPTSALDAASQKLVAAELLRLRDAEGTAMLMVSHNMGVISYLADEILVLYAGLVLEQGPRETVIRRGAHPYTQELIRSIPRMSGPLPRPARPSQTAAGSGTEDRRLLPGCPYAPRCPRSGPRCIQELPPLQEAESGHRVRCWQL